MAIAYSGTSCARKATRLEFRCRRGRPILDSMNREGCISGRVLIGDGRRRQASPRTSGDLCAHAPSRPSAQRVLRGRVPGNKEWAAGSLFVQESGSER